MQAFEHDFWQNSLKFYDKMDLPIQIRIIHNVSIMSHKHYYKILLKIGDKFLVSLTKLVLELLVTSLVTKTTRDTYREKTSSNKTPALTKSMNVDIWAVGTSS